MVKLGRIEQYPSPAQTSLIIAVAIAIFEAINMKLIGLMQLSQLAETAVDVGLLILEMIPTLYFLVYRPLAIHIKHRKLAEDELTKYQAELEQRVLERTAELFSLNEDNLRLFSELQRTNFEITQAYDRTIEGWSKALDLRDKETEGHSLRVAELSLKLGNAMGVCEKDLISIRSGALLHDIGKMGIADNILLKEGPLTDQEWKIMKMHPGFAYEMLLPIKHLDKAIDIPYCHHEKWDGTGYPRGLKGEQIPLNARIFAIVDVWDALTNDRPYRKAWTSEQAYEHIKSEEGKHFDPKVIKKFLDQIIIR